VPRREAEALLDQAQAGIEPIVVLFPHVIPVHPSAPSSEVWLRFRGMAFTGWRNGRIFLGGVDARSPLSNNCSTTLRFTATRSLATRDIPSIASDPSAG
jgi:hypothetical protein